MRCFISTDASLGKPNRNVRSNGTELKPLTKLKPKLSVKLKREQLQQNKCKRNYFKKITLNKYTHNTNTNAYANANANADTEHEYHKRYIYTIHTNTYTSKYTNI